MYNRILITLEVSPSDRAIIEHIKPLAKMMNSTITLLHVATGAPAKWIGPNAGGEEVVQDQAYLDKIRAEFVDAGISAKAELAFGDPVKEIVKWVNEKGCDLVAMSTHGHRLVGDLVFGVTAQKVQHQIDVPVLLLRAKG